MADGTRRADAGQGHHLSVTWAGKNPVSLRRTDGGQQGSRWQCLPVLRWQLRRCLQFVFASSKDVKIFDQKKNADILVRLIFCWRRPASRTEGAACPLTTL